MSMPSNRLHFKTNPRINLSFVNSEEDSDCTIYREATLLVSKEDTADRARMRAKLLILVDKFLEAHV